MALDLLKNANIAAGGVLPMCQDTGTAIVMGKRGQHVLSRPGGQGDERAIARGVFDAYTRLNLRYSQMAPITTWEEKNTGSNLPAQIELYADTAPGHELAYKFLFMAKGGGSANKSFLYQETKAILQPAAPAAPSSTRSCARSAPRPARRTTWPSSSAARPPSSPSRQPSTRSAKYLDELPREGSISAHGFRDVELEQQVLELTRGFGIGAQFGGKYFCHDVRVVRLPRHGASLPIAIAVSCSADRQALGRITPEGVFLEALETDPARFLPETTGEHLADEDGADAAVVRIDLTRPMDEIRAELTKHPVKTRLSLTGPLVVARDIAHAKIKELLDAGQPMPQYLRDHAVYYAGPAKTPEGLCQRVVRPHDRGPDGLLRRAVPGRRRVDGHARQGQPLGSR